MDAQAHYTTVGIREYLDNTTPQVIKLNLPNLPDLPLVDGCLLIDNSTLEYLTTCPRAMEYIFIHKRKLSEDRAALNFGGGIHLALAHRYLHCPDFCNNTQAEADGIQLMMEHFKNFPLDINQFRSADLAVKIFRQYNEVYSAEPFKMLCKQGTTTPLVELPFAHELCRIKVNFDILVKVPDPDNEGGFISEKRDYIIVIYTGRIDLVVQQEGKIYTMDHKTTSMMGDGFFKEQRVSPQHDGYCWAWGQSTGELPHGYIVNGIRTRPPIKRDASGAPARKSTKPRQDVEPDDFQRDYVFIDASRIAEWKRNTIALLEEFLWNYGRGYLPQKKKWCIAKYGTCQFYDICALPLDQRNTLLQSNLFVDNTWSPLNVNHHGEAKSARENEQALSAPVIDMEHLLDPVPSALQDNSPNPNLPPDSSGVAPR